MSDLLPEKITASQVSQLLVSERETRRILGGISARFLWNLTDEGVIPVVRLGRRKLYSYQSLADWVSANLQSGSPREARRE